jgi:hypothetical protein
MLFLSITEGDDATSRQPIFASTDEQLIRAVLDHLTVRLGGRTPERPPPRPLRPVRSPSQPDGGEQR